MEWDQLLQDLGVHAPTVLARFCGNNTLLQRFICKFPAEKTFSALSAAYGAQQLEDTERAVHTLKGIAANLGLESLQLRCASLLDDLRGTQAATAEKYEALCDEYQRVIAYIDRYTEKLGQSRTVSG